MGKTTIEWTATVRDDGTVVPGFTFNPWWGCIEVSPACDECYARTFAKRTGHKVWGPAGETPRRFFADKHWAEPLKWDRDAAAAGERRRVFCASMADVFERNEQLDEHRVRLWTLIEATPHLDWLLLTKRPQNILEMIPNGWRQTAQPNVWYGTTVENQHYADQRIPLLLAVPAAVRFLSMEPLLGPVTLWAYDEDEGALRGPGVIKSGGMTAGTADYPSEGYDDSYPGISWVITGGESGVKARPSHPDWFRSLRDQCQAAGVAFHFKQWGEWLPFDMDASPPLWSSAADGISIDGHVFPDGLSDGEPVKGWLADLDPDRTPVVYRHVGKKTAGRLLDGREWNDVPSPAAAGTGAAPS